MNLVPLCSLQQSLTWLVVRRLKTWVRKEWLCLSLLLVTVGNMTLGTLTKRWVVILIPSQDLRCLTWVKKTCMILLNFLRLTWTRQHMHLGHFMSQRNQLHKNVLSTSWLTCRSAVGVKLVSWVNHDRIIRRNFGWSNLCFSAITASSLIRKLKDPSRFSTFVTWCLDLHLLVLSRTKDALCMLKVNFVVSYLRLDELLVSCRLILRLHLLHLQKLWLPNLVDWHFVKVPLSGNKRKELLAIASNFSTHR